MTTDTARKILNKNGIIWSNYFELDFVSLHTTNQRIKRACEIVKRFIMYGGGK